MNILAVILAFGGGMLCFSGLRSKNFWQYLYGCTVAVGACFLAVF